MRWTEAVGISLT